MPRPPKCRTIGSLPSVTYFKPRGVPMRDLLEICLTRDGYEALRLVDLAGLSQDEAAIRMTVSRQTLGRILAGARRVVAEAVVKGMALRIDGGQVALAQPALDAPAAASLPCRRPTAPDMPMDLQTKTQEDLMTKIAVSSEGPGLDVAVDPRFGRAAGFMIVDVTTMQWEYRDNGASQVLAQGAGIQAAEQIAAAGAQVLLTGYVGPKAFMALSAAGVQIGQDLGGLTVRQAIERYQAGQVTLASQPNAGGHAR